MEARRRPSKDMVIHRVDPILRASLPPSGLDIWKPEAVRMEDRDPMMQAAMEEFCLLANLSIDEVKDKIFPEGEYTWLTRHGYDDDDIKAYYGYDDDIIRFRAYYVYGYSILAHGCFLLRLMVSVCRDDDDDRLISRIRAVAADNGDDVLMSRAEVHTRIDAIVRDVMLLQNQIPWQMLEALMELLNRQESGLGDCAGNYVDRFLALVASFFDAGGHGSNDDEHQAAFRRLRLQHHRGGANGDLSPLDHLLGIFLRHQMMAGGSGSSSSTIRRRRVPILSSVSSTAVELAEMGVKLAASKTKVFGDMSLAKRRWGWSLGLFGELSLAPVVLNDTTACWLMNMAAYEVALGATVADNYAVCSYISMVALLINREEDVQELRAKGIINSAMSDKATLEFFKWAAPRLRLGRRYYDVFQGIQEYRNERWLWISIHRFLYKNSKTIITVLSIVGVLAGLFKTLLSLKQPQPHS